MRTVDDIEREAERIEPGYGATPNGDSNRRFRAQPDHGNGSDAGSGGGVRLMNFKEYRSQQAHSSVNSLVSGLMRLGTVIAIGGRPGSGKTAFAVALAQALDQGEPFLDREVKQAAVAYIAVEDAGDVANRLEATGADGVLLVHSEEGIPLAKPARAKAIIAEVIQHARQRKPGRPIFVVIDTLRAALGGTSVLEDKIVSPALNALRELSEAENAVICILNHTNRADPKAMKGETLEAVAALEMILLPGEGDWHTVHVGKNRSGPGNRQIGRLRFTSVKVGGVEAAIVEEIVCDEQASEGPKDRKPGANQRLILKILTREVLASGIDYRPYGRNGPQVKAVRESVLRDEFMKMKAGDNRNSKNVAFNRALDWLLERAEVVRNEDEAGVGMIWFGSRDDEDDAMRQRLKVVPGNGAGREGDEG
ncbi:AAA family ATPase [Sinorhizobium meliloti]|uniref:AAA family ATPase n=1 Tax=Rhizobium meliloti TaxID=382 RepID=UPI000FD60334|nr:AAA family ATPase [Sinorhizobium meliloti]RVH23569.1 AAA family ATPase [Sinorhizobium meliloti]RVI16571.1 AAA family ATPase [Sinorhizobium meliloti]RVK55601.1 AAA family ATPase [Sinorhizobium meliloti]RVM72633.1 AAA family ATPase [Sinorhizobium meliloti]RVN62294.1 AAA family ATPase [Sinorhizobium meliloti]